MLLLYLADWPPDGPITPPEVIPAAGLPATAVPALSPSAALERINNTCAHDGTLVYCSDAWPIPLAIDSRSLSFLQRKQDNLDEQANMMSDIDDYHTWLWPDGLDTDDDPDVDDIEDNEYPNESNKKVKPEELVENLSRQAVKQISKDHERDQEGKRLMFIQFAYSWLKKFFTNETPPPKKTTGYFRSDACPMDWTKVGNYLCVTRKINKWNICSPILDLRMSDKDKIMWAARCKERWPPKKQAPHPPSKILNDDLTLKQHTDSVLDSNPVNGPIHSKSGQVVLVP